MAKAAVEGAIYNVKINIGGFEDQDFVDEMTKKVGEIKTASDKLADEIRNIVEGKI